MESKENQEQLSRYAKGDHSHCHRWGTGLLFDSGFYWCQSTASTSWPLTPRVYTSRPFQLEMGHPSHQRLGKDEEKLLSLGALLHIPVFIFYISKWSDIFLCSYSTCKFIWKVFIILLTSFHAKKNFQKCHLNHKNVLKSKGSSLLIAVACLHMKKSLTFHMLSSRTACLCKCRS